MTKRQAPTRNLTRQKKPPKGGLNLPRIVGEAIAQADSDPTGLAAVSMRGLASRLGVEAMSLYHHVPGKDALIDAMVDAVVGEIETPNPTKPWRDEMRRRAHSALAVLNRHPWACLPLVARINIGPNMLNYLDRTHGCLLRAGFSHAGADRARHLIDSHIHGFALQEQHFPIAPEDYATSARTFLPTIPAERFPHFHALAATVADGDYDGRNAFDFGLELILDGLARLLRQKHPHVRDT